MDNKSNRRAILAEDVLIVLALLAVGFIVAAIKFVPAVLRWVRST